MNERPAIGKKHDVQPTIIEDRTDPRSSGYVATLTSHRSAPVVTLNPGAKLVAPDANLTPEAKVLYSELVSAYEDWLGDNDIDSADAAMAAQAVQSYIVASAMGIKLPR